MVEEQRLRLPMLLQNVDEIIVPADVREFVGQQSFDVFGRQTGEGSDGNENNRTQPANDGRDLNERGDKETHGSRDSQAGSEFIEHLLPG